jgi:hypothetical protein
VFIKDNEQITPPDSKSRNRKNLTAEEIRNQDPILLERNPQSLTNLNQEEKDIKLDKNTISEKSHESGSDYDSE